MKKSNTDVAAGCLTAIIVSVLTLLFWPIVTFCVGYLGGIILRWAVGYTITDGLNLIFGTTRFTTDVIPVACGALATIGSFFKSSVSTSSNK